MAWLAYSDVSVCPSVCLPHCVLWSNDARPLDFILDAESPVKRRQIEQCFEMIGVVKSWVSFRQQMHQNIQWIRIMFAV